MWQKIKNGLANFMAGRYGLDNLGKATLIVSLALTLLASITNMLLFSILGFILIVITIIRMNSRNLTKRQEENERYLKFKAEIKQFFVRLKNSRKYKYFRCPECGARLRLPRKVGEVNVTCGKCKHQFKMKA